MPPNKETSTDFWPYILYSLIFFNMLFQTRLWQVMITCFCMLLKLGAVLKSERVTHKMVHKTEQLKWTVLKQRYNRKLTLQNYWNDYYRVQKYSMWHWQLTKLYVAYCIIISKYYTNTHVCSFVNVYFHLEVCDTLLYDYFTFYLNNLWPEFDSQF